MKKYLMTLSILIITLLLVTGCGGKKLVCTGTEDDMDMKITTKFEDDTVSELTMEMTMEAPSEDDAKEGKNQMDVLMEPAFTSLEGVKYDSNAKGKKLTITITMDMDKVDTETRNRYLASDKNTYKEVKESFESQNFKCK